jgi:hypothetical protein
MKEAHKFADKAIKEANQSDAMGRAKEWLKTPVEVTRGQFAGILIALSVLVSLIG